MSQYKNISRYKNISQDNNLFQYKKTFPSTKILAALLKYDTVQKSVPDKKIFPSTKICHSPSTEISPSTNTRISNMREPGTGDSTHANPRDCGSSCTRWWTCFRHSVQNAGLLLVAPFSFVQNVV